MTNKNTGTCIGGPMDGEELSSTTLIVNIPVNPHRPRNPSPDSPAVEFDVASYRWSGGAWHWAVH